MRTRIADNAFLIASSFLFVFAPLYFQFNIGSKGINLPFNHTVWFAAVLVIMISIVNVVIDKKSITLPRYWSALVGCPTLLILLGFFSNPINMEEWWLRVGFITGGVAFFFSLFQFNLNQNNIKLILYSLVLSALLQGFIGLTQIYQVRALHGWFPWSHDQRPYGIFQQVNLYASFLATGALIALHLIYSKYLGRQSILVKYLLVISAIFLITMIVVSGSRVGLISVALGAILILWNSLNTRSSVTPAKERHRRQRSGMGVQKNQKIIGPLLRGNNIKQHLCKIADQQHLFISNKTKFCILLILISAVIWFIPSGGINHFKEKFSSSESRLTVYDITLDLIQQKPLTGHGIGSFEQKFKEHRAGYEHRFPHRPLDKRKYTHPHNEILYWVIETGVVSLFGFIILLGAIIKLLYSIEASIRNHYIGLILPISLHAMVEFPFYSSSLHWFVWLWFIFLMSKYDKET